MSMAARRPRRVRSAGFVADTEMQVASVTALARAVAVPIRSGRQSAQCMPVVTASHDMQYAILSSSTASPIR